MERTIYRNTKHFAPRKTLATRAAAKTATVYGQEDYSAESSSEEEEEEDDQHVANDLEGAQSQRERLYTNLLNALCIPSDEMFVACDVIKPTQGLFLTSLDVEGVGKLRIPLSAEDISKLRAVCAQGPTTAWRCWHVDASKITFPEATDFISNTVKPLAMKAVEDLGRYGAVMDLEIHFDKLMLCETGGHYTFHGNEWKQQGRKTFAQFMIQVPTEDGHKGGELLVHHKDSVKSCDCHMVSSLGFCYTIFFLDCKQELQKIKSGTQLCLIFNLVRRETRSDKTLHGELISRKVGEAEAVLQHWLEGATEGKPKLAIPLRQRFTKENLRFARLYKDNKTMVEILKNCRDEDGNRLLNLHLCLATYYQKGNAVPGPHYGSYDSDEEDDDEFYDAKKHIMGDVEEESIDLEDWVGMESTDSKAMKAFTRRGLDLKREVVIREGDKIFDDEPDEVEFDSRWGDYGPKLEKWYHRSMLIMWSRKLSFSQVRPGKKQRLNTDNAP